MMSLTGMTVHLCFLSEMFSQHAMRRNCSWFIFFCSYERHSLIGNVCICIHVYSRKRNSSHASFDKSGCLLFVILMNGGFNIPPVQTHRWRRCKSDARWPSPLQPRVRRLGNWVRCSVGALQMLHILKRLGLKSLNAGLIIITDLPVPYHPLSIDGRVAAYASVIPGAKHHA